METQRTNDGVDRGPFGALVEEVLEISGRDKGHNEMPDTMQNAAEQRAATTPESAQQTAGERDIEAAGG